MRKMRCFIMLLGTFQATRTMVEAQCRGTANVVKGSSGSIQSPNFGKEYGNSANCSWEFALLGNQKAYLLTLTVVKLKTFFTVDGEKICPGRYNLAINKEPVDCERYVDPRHVSSYCNVYFSSPACERLASSKNCEVSNLSLFPIRVVYVSDGRRNPSLILNTSAWGFKMEHNYTECPKETSTTTKKMATTTIAQGDGTEFDIMTTKINQPQTVPTTSMSKKTTMYMSFSQNNETSTEHEATTKVALTRSSANEEQKPTAATLYDVATPEMQNMIIIISAAAGGVLLIVLLIIVIVCIRKRSPKDLSSNDNLENHELTEQQSQPRDVNHDAELVKHEENTPDQPTPPAVYESIDESMQNTSAHEDEATACYTTMSAVASVRSKPTSSVEKGKTSYSTKLVTGNQTEFNGNEEPYSEIGEVKSDQEMYNTLDKSENLPGSSKSEEVYTTMGESSSTNQPSSAVQSAQNCVEMQQAHKDELETSNEERPFYTAIKKSVAGNHGEVDGTDEPYSAIGEVGSNEEMYSTVDKFEYLPGSDKSKEAYPMMGDSAYKADKRRISNEEPPFYTSINKGNGKNDAVRSEKMMVDNVLYSTTI